MRVRITFRSEIYLEGDSLEEIRSEWESIDLYSEEALEHSADFVELVSADDVDTGEELEDEF
jgi:hypothetical protein